jgi:hypothetical protein
MGIYKTSTDRSWLSVYDQYLKGCHTEHRRFDIDPAHDLLLKNTLMTTYDDTVTTNFHVAKQKRPVQNIYKRPV